MRWLGTEKHYSNDKKDILFNIYSELSTFPFIDGITIFTRIIKTESTPQCVKESKSATSGPVVFLSDVSFGVDPLISGSKKTFFQNRSGSKATCSERDEYAVAYLSNFSINNNFSHFLHSLLRLFCALIDAHFIEWDTKTLKFVHRVKYTIWLDEYFRLTAEKEGWLKSLYAPGKTAVRSLATISKSGQCVSSSKLLYGSGCVRLLPPEKWFGYPGCRANEMLPAFGQYMRQTYMALGAEELKLIDEEIEST